MGEGAKWAVLIGINGYHESLGALRYCVADAKRFAEVLAAGEGGYPAGNVRVLSDDEPEDKRPTYANIHSWLATWLSRPKKGDSVLVFFAGHGREIKGKSYLVPSDATLQTLHVTGIPVTYVQELLGRCKAAQKILVLDACHSGAGRDVAPMSGAMLQELSSANGIFTLTSCDVDELSHEWEEREHGVFTHYLAEALSGGCLPDARGRITAEAAYEWTYDRVRAWAAERRLVQTPKRFSGGAGVITLKAAEPDWKELALDLQKRLEAAEVGLLEVKERSGREKAELDMCARVRRMAWQFLADEEGKIGGKRQRVFLEKVRGAMPGQSVPDKDVRAVLREEKERWVTAASHSRVKRSKTQGIAAAVPEFGVWYRTIAYRPSDPGNTPMQSFWIALIGAFLITAFVAIPLTLAEASKGSLSSAAAVAIAVGVPAGVLLTGALVRAVLIRWLRNRYRKHCGDICLSEGDYVGGSGFALVMGRLGVDEAAAGRLIIGLAQISLDDEDTRLARMLLKRAAKLWRSAHAGEMLRSLDIGELDSEGD